MVYHVQVRIDAGDARFFDRAGQRLEPSLGLPLERVLAPKRFVCVARAKVEEEESTLRNRDLGHHLAVNATDGLCKREHGVCQCPESSASG